MLDKYNRFKFDDIEEHVNLFLEEIAFYEDEELNILKEKIEFEIIQLPEKSREVFKAVVLENLTYKQVAERYHISGENCCIPVTFFLIFKIFSFYKKSDFFSPIF